MLIDGRPATQLSIADRGLAYGDGLFETIRYRHDKLLFEDLHLRRLARGCERLGIALDRELLETECRLALRNDGGAEGVLKIIVTRGDSGRGYRSPANAPGRRIVSLHPLPDHSVLRPESGIRAFLCKQRLSMQPALAGIKHLNRLEQVLASREWPDERCFEGLMLDHDGRVIEGTRSNLFFVRNGQLATPALERCGIEGIMREVLLRHYGARVVIGDYGLDELRTADEVFFCNSVFGVWPLLELQQGDGTFQWQAGPMAREAAAIFAQALQ